MIKIHEENRILIMRKDKVAKEISAVDQIADPEYFVFTGYETEIRPNNDTSYYLSNPTESSSYQSSNS